MNSAVDFLYEKYKNVDDKRSDETAALIELFKEIAELNDVAIKERSTGFSNGRYDDDAATLATNINYKIKNYEDAIKLINIPKNVFAKMMAYLVLDQPIQSIKFIRAELDVGLKQAKEFVDKYKNA